MHNFARLNQKYINFMNIFKYIPEKLDRIQEELIKNKLSKEDDILSDVQENASARKSVNEGRQKCSSLDGDDWADRIQMKAPDRNIMFDKLRVWLNFWHWLFIKMSSAWLERMSVLIHLLYLFEVWISFVHN